jgi:hypothetical protein
VFFRGQILELIPCAARCCPPAPHFNDPAVRLARGYSQLRN